MSNCIRTTLCSLSSLSIFLAASCQALAMPKLSKGTRAAGVIAYQDHQDKTQFHYWPANIPLILGDTLQDPSVKYWGVGRKFLEKEPELGTWVWTMGGTISGTAVLDITKHQEQEIRAAITRDFGEAQVKLLPLDAEPVRIQPIFGSNTIGQAGKGDAQFGDGKSFKLGGKFPFIVGSPNNHTFAEYIAGRTTDSADVTNDSSFGVYLVGSAQFLGDPWVFDCKADLRQVWSKVRQRYGAGVGYSWISINLDYASIEQDLFRSKTIDCSFTEAQLDFEKFGRELFEVGKTALLSLNDPDNEYFRFAPNPEPEDIAQKDQKVTMGWGISLNAAYSSAHATQKIEWKEHIEYTGTVRREVPSTLVLAVKCDTRTQQYFTEAGVSESCITSKKAKQFDQWASAEQKCKNDRVKDLYRKLLNGSITTQVYQEGLRIFRIMDCENSFIFFSPQKLAIAGKSITSNAPVAVTVTDEMIDRMLEEVGRGKKLKDVLYSQPEVRAAIQ